MVEKLMRCEVGARALDQAIEVVDRCSPRFSAYHACPPGQGYFRVIERRYCDVRRRLDVLR
jgi:hypothetical protein